MYSSFCHFLTQKKQPFVVAYLFKKKCKDSSSLFKYFRCFCNEDKRKITSLKRSRTHPTLLFNIQLSKQFLSYLFFFTIFFAKHTRKRKVFVFSVGDPIISFHQTNSHCHKQQTLCCVRAFRMIREIYGIR